MNEIQGHFNECESKNAAADLALTLTGYIEECLDEFNLQHCSETGMSVHECDCWDCRDERDILRAEARYDAMKVGDF